MIYNRLAIESKIIGKYHEELRKNDQLLGQIKTINIIHDGGIVYDQKKDKKQYISELHQLSSSTILKRDIIEEYQIEAFSILLYEVIGEQIKETVKMILEETKRITEFTGNVVNMKGGKMDGDKILEMIENMQINFDSEGKPILPQIYCGSEMFNQFKDFKFSPIQQQTFDKIIETKKVNWYAKKRYRRLSYIN